MIVIALMMMMMMMMRVIIIIIIIIIIIQGGSNMTGTDLCVNKSQFVPVIFEPPCSNNMGKGKGHALTCRWRHREEETDV
jgi:hypothetical protein